MVAQAPAPSVPIAVCRRVEIDELSGLAAAVARQMGIDPETRADEVEQVEEAIQLAAIGVAADLVSELRQYAATGKPNSASAYVADCLRLIRKRAGVA